MNLAERFSGTAYAAGIILLMALILAAHVAPFDGVNTYLRGAIFDAGHVLGFGAITVLLVTVLRRKGPAVGLSQNSAQVVALIIVFILAVTSEAAQYPTARNADLADLGRDVCGITVGFLVATAFRLRAPLRMGTLLLAVACLMAGLQHPASTLVAKTIIWLNPSTAFGFERWFEKHLVSSRTAALEVVPAPKNWHRIGHVLRVTPSDRIDLDGLTHYGMPRNWSPYTSLSFTIAAEDADLNTLMLFIDNPKTKHSRRGRFRSVLSIDTEPREVTISLDEIVGTIGSSQLDPTNVESIKILAQDASGRVFFVDDFLLE